MTDRCDRPRRGMSALVAVTLATVVAATALGAGPAARPASAAATHEAAVDVTFPVAGPVTYTDSYAAPRDGGARRHKATDVMAPYGTFVHAAVGGTVSWITGLDGPVPAYGYMITIAGDDGRSYSYIHLGRQDLGPSSAYVSTIRRGVRVERGQHIGFVGCSGNASCSAPHLHFEISDTRITDPYGTHRLNPYASLVDARRRGDVPGAAQPVGGEPACTPMGAVPGYPIRRIAADDPATVSAAVASAGWTSATEALVARADDFADALTGTALAAERDAPLLLVGDRLGSPTTEALERLDVRRVTILGGPVAVSLDVERALAEVVSGVRRVQGSNRFATAAAVRSLLRDTGSEVALALGTHPNRNRAWPDAIAAGALAGAARTTPVLLSTPSRLPAETVAALQAARSAGADTVLVIGGPAAIGEGLVDQVRAHGLSVTRLGGADRYETSLAVVKAAAARGGNNAGTLVAASGLSFVDALPSGPLAAHLGGSLLLVPPCSLDPHPAFEEYLRGRYGDGYVVGTMRAVSEGVREVLTDAVAG